MAAEQLEFNETCVDQGHLKALNRLEDESRVTSQAESVDDGRIKEQSEESDEETISPRLIKKVIKHPTF